MSDSSRRKTGYDDQIELTTDFKKYVEDKIREYTEPLAERGGRTHELLLQKIHRIDVLEGGLQSIRDELRLERARKETSETVHDPVHDDQRGQLFKELAKKWKNETINLSSMQQITSNEAYLSIIGLGPAAISLILNALQSESDWWFCALRAITRADPVPEGVRGNLVLMTNTWLDWGRENGYL